MSDALTIFPPRHPLRGRASPPGSKSITNRALLLAALSEGSSRLTGALKSDDTRYMADALRAMGVSVAEPDATSFVTRRAATRCIVDATLVGTTRRLRRFANV